MKKQLITMIAVLLMSSIALANPVYTERGAEASNALYQERCGVGGDCDDSDRDIRPGRVELVRQTFTYLDPDDDGDGVPTVEETERFSTNQGQLISAVKSDRKPKFKAGAELSKKISSAHVGDLDGDGLEDLVLSIDSGENTLTLTGHSISKRSARTGRYSTQDIQSGGELIEAIASEAGLSKADAKRALDSFVKTAAN